MFSLFVLIPDEAIFMELIRMNNTSHNHIAALYIDENITNTLLTLWLRQVSDSWPNSNISNARSHIISHYGNTSNIDLVISFSCHYFSSFQPGSSRPFSFVFFREKLSEIQSKFPQFYSGKLYFGTLKTHSNQYQDKQIFVEFHIIIITDIIITDLTNSPSRCLS